VLRRHQRHRGHSFDRRARCVPRVRPVRRAQFGVPRENAYVAAGAGLLAGNLHQPAGDEGRSMPPADNGTPQRHHLANCNVNRSADRSATCSVKPIAPGASHGHLPRHHADTSGRTGADSVSSVGSPSSSETTQSAHASGLRTGQSEQEIVKPPALAKEENGTETDLTDRDPPGSERTRRGRAGRGRVVEAMGSPYGWVVTKNVGSNSPTPVRSEKLKIEYLFGYGLIRVNRRLPATQPRRPRCAAP
jgi:hypothetical protein